MTATRSCSRKPAAERFWPKVDRRGDDECWPWTARRRTVVGGHPGYGMFRDEAGKTVQAHRVSWELANGGIPAGLYVLHRCDNRPCVNPAHLFLGTHLDNMRDAAAKGRRPRGEGQSQSKLTDAMVIEIRAAALAGETQCSLAKTYGVGGTVIWLVVSGLGWKHVEYGGRPPRRRRPNCSCLCESKGREGKSRDPIDHFAPCAWLMAWESEQIKAGGR